jgi:hypothetical protein
MHLREEAEDGSENEQKATRAIRTTADDDLFIGAAS